MKATAERNLKQTQEEQRNRTNKGEKKKFAEHRNKNVNLVLGAGMHPGVVTHLLRTGLAHTH